MKPFHQTCIALMVLFLCAVSSGTAPGAQASAPPGLKYPCTSFGPAEQANALTLLQGGMDVCAVAGQLNDTRDPAYTDAVAPGDAKCTCTPDGTHVACREFFTTEATPGTPASTFAVTRCDPTCTNPAGCP